MKHKFKFLIFILPVIFTVFGCKKPFFPSEIFSAPNNYLVIEGVINGDADTTIIKLSRTQKIDSSVTIKAETNAVVTVENDANGNFALTETAPGKYTSLPAALDNSKKYRLRIKTTDNKEYLSEFIAVKNSQPIDSVGFAATAGSVQVYVNTHDDTKTSQYYRWDYEETWQFHAMYPSSYSNDLSARPQSAQVFNCFGNHLSGVVTLASTLKLANDVVYQSPIINIPSTSEKVETKYSILVKQFVLTNDAYAFWQNIQNNTEKLGSIFDVLPSENQSNYHCVTNPNELVVGYLSVGNTASKRIYITADQLPQTYFAIYPATCDIDTAYQNPPGLHSPLLDVLTTPNSLYVPIMGLYLPPPNINGSPTAYTYTQKICGDCTVRGTTRQPAFWR